jgi:hypothetical protein
MIKTQEREWSNAPEARLRSSENFLLRFRMLSKISKKANYFLLC